MTNEERQQVIQALELGRVIAKDENSPSYDAYFSKALAIMQREDKRQPDAWQWLNTAHYRKKLPPTAERSHWNPLYKD